MYYTQDDSSLSQCSMVIRPEFSRELPTFLVPLKVEISYTPFLVLSLHSASAPSLSRPPTRLRSLVGLLGSRGVPVEGFHLCFHFMFIYIYIYMRWPVRHRRAAQSHEPVPQRTSQKFMYTCTHPWICPWGFARLEEIGHRRKFSSTSITTYHYYGHVNRSPAIEKYAIPMAAWQGRQEPVSERRIFAIPIKSSASTITEADQWGCEG